MPPLKSNIPTIITVHDLTHLHYYTGLHAAYYDFVLRPLFRRCHTIFCVSQFTRTELLDWSGISPEKVLVVSNGVSPRFFTTSSEAGIPFPYVLYPGNRRPYKNIERLCRAYAGSVLPARGIHLLMTGEQDEYLSRLVQSARIEGYVHATGVVSEQRLAELYRSALLVALVSLYEGFGLPILEAMASGVPVLTSNVSAMPEIAAGASLLINPSEIAEIRDGLELLAFDEGLRASLIQKGIERAAQFNWANSAKKVWNVVCELDPALH